MCRPVGTTHDGSIVSTSSRRYGRQFERFVPAGSRFDPVPSLGKHLTGLVKYSDSGATVRPETGDRTNILST
jgi:hypothetical protein